MNLSLINFERIVSRWGILVVFLASILVFANTLAMGFVYDDFTIIFELPLIRDIKNLPLIFTTDVWLDAGRQTPYYRPLGYASFAIDYSIWKDTALGYHLTNTLLHGCVSVLVLQVAHKLSDSRLTAFWAAMFFALHPVHSDAVAWISGRGEILSCGFMLAAFILYLRSRETTNIKVIQYVAATFYLFSLMCKETAVTLPLLVLLYEIAVCRNYNLKSLLIRITPFAVAIAIYLTLRFAFIDIFVWNNTPFVWRLWTSITLVVAYIKSLVFPFDLKVFYDIPIQKSPYSSVVFLSLAILTVITVILGYIFRRNRLLFFSFVWCGVVLLPVCGIVTLLNPALIADRYLYIPSVGLSFAFGIIINRSRPLMINFRQYKIIQVCGFITLLMLALLTVIHNNNWRDQQTFIRSLIADAPNNEFAHYNRGQIAQDTGHFDEAIKEFSKAITIHPKFAEAHYSLGVIAFQQGRLHDAEKAFLKTLEYEPKDIKAINNLGSLYGSTGRLSEAIKTFERGLAAIPGDIMIRTNLEIARKELAKKEQK